MVAGVSPIMTGSTRTAAVVRDNASAAEARDKKIKVLSEKMYKLFYGRAEGQEIDHDQLFPLLRGLTKKDVFIWLRRNRVLFDEVTMSLMSDENLAMIALTIAPLPKNIYRGAELGMYSRYDESVASYDRLSKKLCFNSGGKTRAFMEREEAGNSRFHYTMSPDNKFSGILVHELMHRWADIYDCSDFFRISWEEGLEGTGVYDLPRSGRDEMDPNDFAESYGTEGYLEDLSTVVQGMVAYNHALIEKAVQNIVESLNTNLADKIFFCYKFYEKANDPENWIVRTETGNYIYRSEGKTCSIEFDRGKPVQKMIFDQVDPNAFIYKYMQTAPMELRSTK